MKIMCYALFACAFNLLLGYTGLLSFGHAAFLGGAAYATGHSLAVWGFPTIVGLLFGTGVAAVMGLVMGALAIRRSGIYFAMITLAMAQMVFRSEEHTSELQSLMRTSYAVFCLKKKKIENK